MPRRTSPAASSPAALPTEAGCSFRVCAEVDVFTGRSVDIAGGIRKREVLQRKGLGYAAGAGHPVEHFEDPLPLAGVKYKVMRAEVGDHAGRRVTREREREARIALLNAGGEGRGRRDQGGDVAGRHSGRGRSEDHGAGAAIRTAFLVEG